MKTTTFKNFNQSRDGIVVTSWKDQGIMMEVVKSRKAFAVEKNYFRFAESVIGDITDEDFLTYCDLGKAPEDCCKGHALSLLPSVSAVRRKIRRYKKIFGSKRIIELKVSKDTGKVKDDHKDHSSWWHPIDFDPKTLVIRVVTDKQGLEEGNE